MQSFMDAQRGHIIAMVRVFKDACRMAATKDDGKISKEEAIEIKQIDAAVTKFISDLQKIK